MMPWTGPEFHAHHNHGLSPTQSVHAAHIANAILHRGAPEGIAISTANKLAHRAPGGMVPNQQPDPQQAVLARSVAQRLAPMSTDQLRELIPRLGDTPIAQIAQGILQQKLAAEQPQPQAVQPQVQQPAPAQPQTAMAPRASGGRAEGMQPKETVPILAAGGEFVVAPHHVARLGGGDVGEGHRRLDKWVVDTRKKIVEKMKSLKPPVKS